MKPIYLIIAGFLLLQLTGCKKKKETTQPQNQITSKFYFTANIGGQSILYQDGVNGYASGAEEAGGSAAGGDQEQQGLVIEKPLSSTNLAVVYIVKTFTDAPTQCSQIEDMFHTGGYPFGKIAYGSTDNGVDGVVIQYYDSKGTLWSSDQGTGIQTNHSFQITEHINNTDGYSQKITKATFSCTLYDTNGNSKELTNGEIRSRSVQCGGL